MSLSRQELVEISERYFEGCNAHNFGQVMDTFADDCLMRFPSAEFVYKDKQALDAHFKDFLSTFKTIDFRDYTHIPDPETQSILTYFEVRLIDHNDQEVNMKNCNIFHLNEAGLFKEIIIYNSGALDAGFQDGNG